jgi:perosamine synthetase
VDVDSGTLAVRPWALEAALTPRTRVVLVAHLFGGRMDLGGLAKFVKDRGLLLVEDCAQAFQGPKRMGDSEADVSMYSFGTLKTSTALGGAVLRVRDGEVLSRMRGIQASYPPQGRGGYLKKLLGILGIVGVSRPAPTVCSREPASDSATTSTRWWAARCAGSLRMKQLRRSSGI